jgi:BCD family chlorophyll transporter-like MFS transporter
MDFTPGRLVRVIQTAALLTLALNVIAVWKQEPRRRQTAEEQANRRPQFQRVLAEVLRG